MRYRPRRAALLSLVAAIMLLTSLGVSTVAHAGEPIGYPGDAYTATLAAALKERFGIDHATVQIETDPGTECALEPAGVV